MSPRIKFEPQKPKSRWHMSLKIWHNSIENVVSEVSTQRCRTFTTPASASPSPTPTTPNFNTHVCDPHPLSFLARNDADAAGIPSPSRHPPIGRTLSACPLPRPTATASVRVVSAVLLRVLQSAGSVCVRACALPAGCPTLGSAGACTASCQELCIAKSLIHVCGEQHFVYLL